MVASKASVLSIDKEDSVKAKHRRYNATVKGKERDKRYDQSLKGRYSHMKRDLRYHMTLKIRRVAQLEEELQRYD